MKTKTKIKAFTLSELIVVLILSTIIVGLAFSVLTLVQRHMFSITKNLKANTAMNKLEQSLWVDFNKYSIVNYSGETKVLKMTSEIDSVSYKFSDNYIIKGADTFNVLLENKTFFFEAKEVDTGYIDAIKLKTTKEARNQELFIFMETDANVYMK